MQNFITPRLLYVVVFLLTALPLTAQETDLADDSSPKLRDIGQLSFGSGLLSPFRKETVAPLLFFQFNGGYFLKNRISLSIGLGQILPAAKGDSLPVFSTYSGLSIRLFDVGQNKSNFFYVKSMGEALYYAGRGEGSPWKLSRSAALFGYQYARKNGDDSYFVELGHTIRADRNSGFVLNIGYGVTGRESGAAPALLGLLGFLILSAVIGGS